MNGGHRATPRWWREGFLAGLRGNGLSRGEAEARVRAWVGEEAVIGAEAEGRSWLGAEARRQLRAEAGDAAWADFEQAWKRGREKRLAGTSA